MHPEYQYLNTLKDILENGERVPNRTGVDTLRVLGVTHRYDFEKDGFPLFTTKKVWWKGVAHELLWFLSGSTNIKYLVDNGVNIWNDDAYRDYKNDTERINSFRDAKIERLSPLLSKEDFITTIKESGLGLGELGPVYGSQWRNWTGKAMDYDGETEDIDQIANLVSTLKNNPSSRRHILSAWNPAEIDDMALPPCHLLSQFTISKGKLWCHMYQRSCDMFLGVPFNVASYSLLTYMLAHVTGLEPGGFIHTMHDTHIYANHIDAVKEQITRTPGDFPEVNLNPAIENIDDFKFKDIWLNDYEPQSTIKAKLNT